MRRTLTTALLLAAALAPSATAAEEVRLTPTGEVTFPSRAYLLSLPPGACPLTTLDEYRTLKMGLAHILLKQMYEHDDRIAREKEQAESKEAGASRPRGRSKAAPVSRSR